MVTYYSERRSSVLGTHCTAANNGVVPSGKLQNKGMLDQLEAIGDDGSGERGDGQRLQLRSNYWTERWLRSACEQPANA